MNSLGPCIWVISDGRHGIENQALGLAQAMRRHPPISTQPAIIKRKIIGSDPSFARLPPPLQLLKRPRPKHYSLAAPYPDITIGCGRQAIAPLRLIKKHSPGSFTVYIQDPRSSYTHFDLIIAPEHDRLVRPNAVSILGAPNLIAAETLAAAKRAFQDQFQSIAAPRAAFLIGGSSKRRIMSADITAAHIKAAQNLMDSGHYILASLSRRTETAARQSWQAFAAANPAHIWLYDGARDNGPNPYAAFLAYADIICVTEESTNMLTEACTAGAPVFRLPMGGQAGKFTMLYDALKSRCHVDIYTGQDQTAYKAITPSPLQETDRIAKLVWDRIAGK